MLWHRSGNFTYYFFNSMIVQIRKDINILQHYGVSFHRYFKVVCVDAVVIDGYDFRYKTYAADSETVILSYKHREFSVIIRCRPVI